MKEDPHKAQWERLEKENLAKSREKGDIYDVRAGACRRLLNQLPKP